MSKGKKVHDAKGSEKMEKIVSLAKRRGFIYQNAEIHGGFAGMFDYAPYGLLLKRNIVDSWRKSFVEGRANMYEIDSAVLTKSAVLEASGHVSGFTDPLVECKKCKRRFRADQLEDGTKCPECGGALTEQRAFNMMFETRAGAMGDSASTAYLRPETAQGIFTNFKNIIDSFHPSLPFGIAQVGKAFRNEITPRDFLFRAREFEQMEIEYFVSEENWKKEFETWQKDLAQWTESLGIQKEHLHEVAVSKEDLAHYSKQTIDFEYEYPFGQKELFGLAYRTDHDLKKHMEKSGVDLQYFEEATGKRSLPHVIEPSIGLDRMVLAVLLDAYREEQTEKETRVYLQLKPEIAPVKVAVFPLLKNKPELVKRAKEVFDMLQKTISRVSFDDNGNIGKRYRRQDEVGTPFCVTVDFDSFDDDSVTVRGRDTMAQERVKILELSSYFHERIGE